MAIDLTQTYPGQVDTATTEYPLGKARNVTKPGDNAATPFDQAWLNDMWGFQQALLLAAELTPSGAPDTATNSQYLDALLDAAQKAADIAAAAAAEEVRVTVVNETGQSTEDAVSQKIYSDRVALLGTAANKNTGTAAGEVVVRDANGYPTNNNALGVGQTWQDMTASRLSGVTYTNTTGRPIMVSFTRFITSGGTASTLTLDGITTQSRGHTGASAGSGHGYDFVVPNQGTYSITTGGGTSSWLELR